MGKKKIITIGEIPESFENKKEKKIPKQLEKPVPEKNKEKKLEEKKSITKPISFKEEKTKEVKKTTEVKSKLSKPQKSKKKIRSKKYQEVYQLIDKQKLYSLNEAIKLTKKTSYSKFNGNIEVHIRLNIDLEKSGEHIRTIIKFPKFLGKKPKILAFTNKKSDALKAGATYAGGDELIEKISKGWTDFNLVLAEPSFMPRLGKIAKNLGTRGMMPNPKTGTITNNISEKIKKIFAGEKEIKNDSGGIIHQVIGSIKDKEEDLIKNMQILFQAIQKFRSGKKDFVKSIYLSSSMGPSIKVDPNTIDNSKSF